METFVFDNSQKEFLSTTFGIDGDGYMYTEQKSEMEPIDDKNFRQFIEYNQDLGTKNDIMIL